MAQRAKTTLAECFLTSCVWARFPMGSHTMLDSGIVSPLRLRWVRGMCVFRCNPPPALLAEWPGSFTCHCGNMGVERTPNKSQHTKLTLEKKMFPPLLPGFELTTFRSRVRCYYQHPSTAKSHLKTNYTFKTLLYKSHTQVISKP